MKRFLFFILMLFGLLLSLFGVISGLGQILLIIGDMWRPSGDSMYHAGYILGRIIGLLLVGSILIGGGWTLFKKGRKGWKSMYTPSRLDTLDDEEFDSSY